MLAAGTAIPSLLHLRWPAAGCASDSGRARGQRAASSPGYAWCGARGANPERRVRLRRAPVPGADRALYLGATNRLTTNSYVGLGTAVMLRHPRTHFYRPTNDGAVKVRFELRQNNMMVFTEPATTLGLRLDVLNDGETER